MKRKILKTIIYTCFSIVALCIVWIVAYNIDKQTRPYVYPYADEAWQITK